MDFKINLENMKEVYGNEIVEIMLNNIDIIQTNTKILKKLGFNEIEEMIERYPNLFINLPEKFKAKFEKLRQEEGENWIELIENDMSILEKIDK